MATKPKPILKINRLYDKCLHAIQREVHHISTMSIAAKLPVAAAKDLRDYTKLLKEMKTEYEALEAEAANKAEAAAKAMPDEDLRKAVVGS